MERTGMGRTGWGWWRRKMGMELMRMVTEGQGRCWTGDTDGDTGDKDGDRTIRGGRGSDGRAEGRGPRPLARHQPLFWGAPGLGEPGPDSSPPPGAEDPRLSTTRSVKQPPQRRESFDTCPSPGPAEPFPALQESPEEKPKAQEELRGGPEAEGESGARSEPSTPKPGRAALLGAGGGRSPAATRSRAEKCGGVHISGPFSVTVPFHITSNLSRLTRGQPCPALGSASPPPPTHHSAGEPAAPEIPTGEIFGDGTDPVTPGGGLGNPPDPQGVFQGRRRRRRRRGCRWSCAPPSPSWTARTRGWSTGTGTGTRWDGCHPGAAASRTATGSWPSRRAWRAAS